MSRAGAGLVLALWAQFGFTACSYPAYAPNHDYRGHFAPGAQRYGVEGSVTADELAIVEYLAWPQAQADVVGTLGFPAHRVETADYYDIEGTDQWLVVFYSGSSATGYAVERRTVGY